MFLDYEAVIAPDGHWVDLQHLFVGLDALAHKERKAKVSKLGATFEIGTSWAAATSAGDLGSAVGDSQTQGTGAWSSYAMPRTVAVYMNFFLQANAPDWDPLGGLDPWGIRPILHDVRGHRKWRLGRDREPVGAHGPCASGPAAHVFSWARSGLDRLDRGAVHGGAPGGAGPAQCHHRGGRQLLRRGAGVVAYRRLSARPRFQLSSKPNQWVRQVSLAKKHAGITDAKRLQLEDWTAVRDHIGSSGSHVRPQIPLPQHWTKAAMGRTGFLLQLYTNTRMHQIGVALVMNDGHAKAHFLPPSAATQRARGGRGGEVGLSELPEAKESRIGIWRSNQDVAERDRWPEQHAWLQDMLERIHDVFRPHVKQLDSGAGPPTGAPAPVSYPFRAPSPYLPPAKCPQALSGASDGWQSKC